jgi:hypothetical protein
VAGVTPIAELVGDVRPLEIVAREIAAEAAMKVVGAALVIRLMPTPPVRVRMSLPGVVIDLFEVVEVEVRSGD